MLRRAVLIGFCFLGVLTLSAPLRAAPDADFIKPDHTPAPPFALPDISGQTVKSASLAGKVAVLSFGATWCPNCTGELQSFENLQARFPKDLVVYFVALDGRGEKDVKPFLEKSGRRVPTLIDPRMEVAREYGIRWIPVTVIVDRHGVVVGRATGPHQWDSQEAVAFVQSLLQH